MKSYCLPFLMLDEFAKLPRPEKLLLIGLYHQWINNNCLPVRLDKVDINMLRLLTNSDDLSLESLHKRKWWRMRRCGLLFSDQSISFVTNPEDNLAVNLSLRKSDKPISSHSKQTINVRKTCVKVRKHDVNVRKTNAKVRKPYEVKFSTLIYTYINVLKGRYVSTCIEKNQKSRFSRTIK